MCRILWRDDVVITVLEASVAADRASDLERVYRERTAQVPSDIIETFLVRDTGDARVFRIITVWVSREALERMRSSGVKPTGVVFHIGSSPFFFQVAFCEYFLHQGDLKTAIRKVMLFSGILLWSPGA
jgi:hypothetical protein